MTDCRCQHPEMCAKAGCYYDQPSNARQKQEPTSAYDLVRQQAEDEGLWFNAQTGSESYLQMALRMLHAAVERETDTRKYQWLLRNIRNIRPQTAGPGWYFDIHPVGIRYHDSLDALVAAEMIREISG